VHETNKQDVHASPKGAHTEVPKVSTYVLSLHQDWHRIAYLCSNTAISFFIEMQTPKGMATAWALLDGAECTFVHRRWATTQGVKIVEACILYTRWMVTRLSLTESKRYTANSERRILSYLRPRG
jgi:hypothetical protein